jgi:hypothetical protein
MAATTAAGSARASRAPAFNRPNDRPTTPDAPTRAGASGSQPPDAKSDKPEPRILFQSFFKSVGPRTYAAQVKEASNGNHFLVLTEGKRDDKTGDVRKTRLLVFSEDFEAFFGLLRETAEWTRANPVPPDVVARQKKYWSRGAASDRRPGK